MSLGTSVKATQERKLWQSFEQLLGHKKMQLRQRMSSGPSIYCCTSAPASTLPAVWMPNALGDLLVQYSGNSPVALWVCTVTNTTTTYTWVGIAGTSIGTTVTQA